MRYKRKLPINNQHKQRICFAWFPTRINDNTVIWLERYIQNYTYYKWLTKEGGFWEKGYKELYGK